MGKADKLVKRFLSKPKDFTFDELRKLLACYGYEEIRSGKTSGSRVTFKNSTSKHRIKLHKPHPSPIVKPYLMEFIEKTLREEGYLK